MLLVIQELSMFVFECLLCSGGINKHYFDVKQHNIKVFLSQVILTHLLPMQPFLYPSKTSENLTVFCFQGVEEECIGNEWVKCSFTPPVFSWILLFLILLSKRISSKYLPVQRQQQKHYKKVRNTFKVNNKDDRMASINFEHISYLFLMLLLLNLSMYLFARLEQEIMTDSWKQLHFMHIE